MRHDCVYTLHYYRTGVCLIKGIRCIFTGPSTHWVIFIRSYKPLLFFPGKITNIVLSISVHTGLLNLQ